MNSETVKLSAAAVRKVFMACLYDRTPSEEEKAGAVLVQGVRINAGFDPDKLKEQVPRITALLMQLPKEFMDSSGDGGWSFLQACMDREGQLWTGDHLSMDELMVLGLAAKRVALLVPRELWSGLPGGVPYFVVKDRDLVEGGAREQRA